MPLEEVIKEFYGGTIPVSKAKESDTKFPSSK
uniref:Uncharacterized protein n=1 Tax=Saccharolobus solfataricus (strain 98/2) TaxID=555311 RepID=D0KUP7_SACS9